MKTIKERMLVVWNDDGSFRGASLDERFVYDDGSTRNAQRPLTEADADALVGLVDASTVAQLEAANATIATLTQERDSLQSQVDPLNATITELRAQIEALQNPPFNPKVLHPYSFLQRYTVDERLAILTAAKEDVTVQLILSELQTVSRVRLDAEATRNGVGYLQSIGIIDAARAAEILRDATAEEQ